MILTDEQIREASHYAEFMDIVDSHLEANARIRELENEGLAKVNAEHFRWYHRWRLEANACEKAQGRANRLAVVADALAVECQRLKNISEPMRVLDIMDAIEQHAGEVEAEKNRADRAEARVAELESINRGLLKTLEECGERLRKLVEAAEWRKSVRNIGLGSIGGLVAMKELKETIKKAEADYQAALVAAKEVK